MLSYKQMKLALQNPNIDGKKRDFYREMIAEKERVERHIERMGETRRGKQTTLDVYFKLPQSALPSPNCKS